MNQEKTKCTKTCNPCFNGHCDLCNGPCHQPEQSWEKKFLNAGTEKGCGDLSIMVGTVSGLLAKAKKKGEESGKKEAATRYIKMVNQDPMKCPECQAPMVPDLDSKPDHKDEWDGHVYKASCKCFSPHMRLCKG